MKKIFALIIALLLFTACAEGPSGFISSPDEAPKEELNLPFSEDSESIIAEESEISKATESFEESKPDQSEVSEEIPEAVDLFTEMAECGETLTAYGELKKEEYAELLASLESVLDEYEDNISITVCSLDNSKGLCYNTESRIFCASAIKAPYVFYALKLMEKDGISLETEMIYEEKHYEIGTGNMQYSELGTVFDMGTILRETMRISDNVGYNMAVDYFGREGYNRWISEIGAPTLEIKPTVWCLGASSRDLAFMWKEIYRYFQTESENAEFLYDSCTDTGGNFATAALDGVKYSHKQGHNRSDGWHSYTDAGIVWNDGNPYVISVITDTAGPCEKGEKVMADIIKTVDEIF